MKLPPGNPKHRKLARAISSFLGISGLAVWFFHFCVWNQYDQTRPTRADYSTGRVHGLNNHGHVVYLTDEEDARLTRLTILAFSLMVSGGLTAVSFVEGISNWNKGRTPWEKKRF
jgi:hypothetical protein